MNNKEKKMLIIRLVIFCVLAYLPIYVMTPVLNKVCGEFIFSESASGKTLVVAYAVGVFGMFAPAVAHLLTRLFTKEGFKDTYLSLNFKGHAEGELQGLSLAQKDWAEGGLQAGPGSDWVRSAWSPVARRRGRADLVA